MPSEQGDRNAVLSDRRNLARESIVVIADEITDQTVPARRDAASVASHARATGQGANSRGATGH